MGKTQQKLGVILACGAAMVVASRLVSCNTWQIGKYIEESYITCEGVDVSKPVEGKVYRAVQGGEPHYYVLAPEITFHPCRKAVDTNFMESRDRHFATDIRPTGKQRWVEVKPDRIHCMSDRHGRDLDFPCAQASWYYEREVDKLPPNATVYRQGVGCDRPFELHELGGVLHGNSARVVEDRSQSAMAKICSAPFTYCIDPLLNGVTTVVGVPVAAVLVSGAGLMDKCQHQISDKPEDPDTLLQPETRTMLQGVNLLEVSRLLCGSCQMPDGSTVGYTPRRFKSQRLADGTVQDSIGYINLTERTWVSELPFYIDKSKPCVLYGSLSDADVEAVAAPLRAQGFRVIGVLSYGTRSYHYKALPQPPSE